MAVIVLVIKKFPCPKHLSLPTFYKQKSHTIYSCSPRLVWQNFRPENLFWGDTLFSMPPQLKFGGPPCYTFGAHPANFQGIPAKMMFLVDATIPQTGTTKD